MMLRTDLKYIEGTVGRLQLWPNCDRYEMGERRDAARRTAEGKAAMAPLKDGQLDTLGLGGEVLSIEPSRTQKKSFCHCFTLNSA